MAHKVQGGELMEFGIGHIPLLLAGAVIGAYIAWLVNWTIRKIAFGILSQVDPNGKFALLNELSAFRFSSPTLGASFTPRGG